MESWQDHAKSSGNLKHIVTTLNIPLLLGTNRKDRKSESVAHWLLDQMKQRDIATKLFDVADFDLPRHDYGQGLKDSFPEWRDAIINADGLVIVTPEYNHGYPGTLKAVLDLLLPEYIHKAVALVGVSAGPWGGTRVIEALVPMVRELGLAVTFSDLNFPKVQNTFDAAGKLLDPAFEKRAKGFLDELAWMARVLKWGRENVPSKYHAT
jgi:NAD(P)H-dependent FMN reductase